MIKLILAVVLMSAASPVLAAGGGEAGPFLGLPRPLWYTVNLVLFLGLLGYLVARPLNRFFTDRSAEVSRQLAEAQRQQEEAVALRHELDRRVHSLEAEVTALRRRLREEAERDRQALDLQGEREAARLVQQVDAEVHRRLLQAREVLARDAATLAADLAWELLEREMEPADQERIFQRTLQRLQAAGEGTMS